MSWVEKSKNLKKIFTTFEKKNNYDCILPISGGKDSTFQCYTLNKIYKVNALAVTHGTNWSTLDGRYNLELCISKFNFDHLFFLPRRKIVNKVAARSVDLIGDACWHCHIGHSTFPLQTAVNWNISLLVYGESVAEKDSRGSYLALKSSAQKFYYALDISAKVLPEKFVTNRIKLDDLQVWNYPSKNLMVKNKINYLHLGDFIFWDEQKQVDFIVNHIGWKESKRVENTYKGYKSNECVMAGVHDYFNFLKRGVGRATLHASEDIRRGLITRSEGVKLIQRYDAERPHALDYFIKITNIKEKKLEKKIINSRKFSKYAIKIEKK